MYNELYLQEDLQMKKIFILSVSILLIVGISYGQIPREITYQGYLTDNANNPITNNLQLTFTLYDAQSGGSSLWSEVHPSVAIIQGVFRVSLGSITPLNLPFDAPYWLSIKVGADPELAPRIALSSVGYSFSSLKAESVENLAENSVSTSAIQNESVTLQKISPTGASSGQSITYNGSNVVWQTPSSGLDGSGTTNYLPRFTGSTQLGNSAIFQNSTNIGLGTTSPAAKFHLVGDMLISGSAGNLQFYDRSNPVYKYNIFVASSSLNFAYGEQINIRLNGANTYLGEGFAGAGPRLTVGTSGDGSYARANSWQLFSDERFKTNISSLKDVIPTIQKIRGVSFNWKKSGFSDIGFIAQEIEKVLPNIVGTDEETGYKSVDYARLTPLLVEAVKQQQKEIEKLKEQVDILTRELGK
jgi:hypothetical protein